ncbi:anti-adapter protein iraM [Enterobacter sp. E76]|nr:anti-adapter protein iraM [Enterobacter sp. E76]
MEWVVEKQLVCPSTGTFFALVSSARNLKLILWYKGSYFIRTGNSLNTGYFGVNIKGRARNIEIIHAFPFNPVLWNTFKSTMSCPGNDALLSCECNLAESCLFKICPYGIRPLKE